MDVSRLPERAAPLLAVSPPHPVTIYSVPGRCGAAQLDVLTSVTNDAQIPTLRALGVALPSYSLSVLTF